MVWKKVVRLDEEEAKQFLRTAIEKKNNPLFSKVRGRKVKVKEA